MSAERSIFDALVIGSGVGGSVAAALLARNGKRVLVLEKNAVFGGILASYRKRGFKIDLGSHLIAQGAHGDVARALQLAGATSPRFITHRVPVRSRGIFDISAPEHRGGLFKTAFEALEKLHIPPVEAARLGRLVFQIFTLTELELAAWDRRTLDELFLEHTEHPGAYFLFSFLASIFFVLPPWAVSAGEAVRSLRRMLHHYSLSYVEGGMDAVIDALLEVVRRGNGEILPRRTVVAIRRGSHGYTVDTDDGREYRAPIIVANTAPGAFADLARDLVLPEEYLQRLRAIRGSGNAHQLKLGLDRKLVDEGCLIGGLSLSGLTVGNLKLDLLRRTVDSIGSGRVSDPLAIYAPIPSNYDPSLAPPGCQLMVASVYAPVGPPIDPPEVWKASILRALETIVPGINEAIIFCDFSPVPAIGRWMGRANNAAISNGQYPGQVGRDRLPVATPLPGLFLCGDSAGGRGIGTELAALSGMEAARAILEARP